MRCGLKEVVAWLVSIGGVVATFAPIGAEAPTQAWRLQNGLNYVDFTGDGVDDFVTLGYRPNLNAHGFNVVSFFTSIRVDESGRSVWYVVPLIADGQEDLNVRVEGVPIVSCAISGCYLAPRP